MAENASNKQLYIDKRHFKDPKELKVLEASKSTAILKNVRHTTLLNVSGQLAGTITFCFAQ